MTLLFYFIFDCGSNANILLRDAYEGASPRARKRLNEAGGKVRVQDGVCLLRVQSVRAGLDRLCSGRDLDFKEVQRAFTVIQVGRGKNNSAYSVNAALRASIALGSQPGASSAKPIMERTVFQRRKKRFALILEQT